MRYRVMLLNKKKNSKSIYDFFLQILLRKGMGKISIIKNKIFITGIYKVNKSINMFNTRPS